jgi:hypothetical protein
LDLGSEIRDPGSRIETNPDLGSGTTEKNILSSPGNMRGIGMVLVVFWIHRIRKFLGLRDPNPDPSIIKQKSKKNRDFYCVVTSL